LNTKTPNKEAVVFQFYDGFIAEQIRNDNNAIEVSVIKILPYFKLDLKLKRNFLFDDRFLKKANEMLEEFKQKNSIIPKNVKVYISKNTTLNAYCLPDGTFVLHMGLFYWLKKMFCCFFYGFLCFTYCLNIITIY
jgi:hypothetical protein